MESPEFSKQLNLFSNKVYKQLTADKPNENVVFSPFSIQTCAAMARLGAEHETAEELERGLGLTSRDVHEIADSYHKVLAEYESSSVLHIANKIYVMKGYTVRDEFNKLLKKKFYSSAESIDFGQNQAAAGAINAWVQSKTNNLIEDLVPAGALDSTTRVVLLNAIHFKGEWVEQFPREDTRAENFYLNDTDTVSVQMMNLRANFHYADLPKLNATALQLPYKDSDLAMLVILPNSRTGLQNLEAALQNTQLSQITAKLYSTKVTVKLPKFKAEFSAELNAAFKALGMQRMFSDAAEFGKMLETEEPMQVSSILHKAFIEVNEEGTEAAAATAMIACRSLSLGISPPRTFTADRPFVYVVKDQHDIPLFVGHYATNNSN